MKRRITISRRFLFMLTLLVGVLSFLAVAPVTAQTTRTTTVPSHIDEEPSATVATGTMAVALFVWEKQTDAEVAFREAFSAGAGVPVRFDIFNAEGSQERLEALLAAVTSSEYRIIYTQADRVTATALEMIKGTPIIFNLVEAPVRRCLIVSWNYSGGEITGVSSSIPIAEIYAVMLEHSEALRIGVVFDSTVADESRIRHDVKRLRNYFGSHMELVDLSEESHTIDDRIKQLEMASLDIVYFVPGAAVTLAAKKITSSLTDAGIPTITTSEELAAAAHIYLAVTPDYRELGALAASQALDVINGTYPTDLPCLRPVQLITTVNEEVGALLATEKQRSQSTGGVVP